MTEPLGEGDRIFFAKSGVFRALSAIFATKLTRILVGEGNYPLDPGTPVPPLPPGSGADRNISLFYSLMIDLVIGRVPILILVRRSKVWYVSYHVKKCLDHIGFDMKSRDHVTSTGDYVTWRGALNCDLPCYKIYY